MFQPEETVTYVPATYTPDFVYVPDNVYPVYYPVYYTVYPVYCPVYEPVYYHDLTPDFYPKPLTVETAVEECFLPSPQPPQDLQPVLPKWEPTLTTIQEHNDEDQDITVNMFLGGRAMFPPENVFVPQNVSPPEPASSPEALPETLYPHLSEPQLASDLPPVQTDNAASINASPLLPLTWGQIMDALDAELEEAEKHKEQEVSKEKESYELLEEKRENVIEKKDKIEEVIDKKEKVEELDKKKRIEQRKKTADVRKQTFAYSTQNPKGVELFIRGLDFKIDEQRLYKLFHPFGNIIRAKLMTKNGQSKGYGYITYSSDAEAKTAIREMNGKIVGSKLLNITLSKTEEERAQQKMGSGWKRRTWQKYNKD